MDLLIKWGNHKDDVIKMVDLHFDYDAQNAKLEWLYK